MGTHVELNDTLQITTDQGFPDILSLERHRKTQIRLEYLAEGEFKFRKPGARIFHVPPTRVFLVHNINGKWLYWGHALVTRQTIIGEDPRTQTTEGYFKVIKIYDPAYQEQATRNESPVGCSYF